MGLPDRGPRRVPELAENATAPPLDTFVATVTCALLHDNEYQGWPGGMRGAIESGAPFQRKGGRAVSNLPMEFPKENVMTPKQAKHCPKLSRS